jgi:hypothetical protein
MFVPRSFRPFHIGNRGIIIDGTFWDFTSDLAKGDTAYTTLALAAHTDTTYFVHCLNLLNALWLT